LCGGTQSGFVDDLQHFDQHCPCGRVRLAEGRDHREVQQAHGDDVDVARRARDRQHARVQRLRRRKVAFGACRLREREETRFCRLRERRAREPVEQRHHDPAIVAPRLEGRLAERLEEGVHRARLGGRARRGAAHFRELREARGAELHGGVDGRTGRRFRDRGVELCE